MTSALNVLRVFVDVTAIVVLITPAIKYVIGMTKRQSELSDIDERIKRSQREALDRSEATRQQENEEADRTIRELAAKVDEIAARERVDTMLTGSALIAAEVALRYASFELKKLHGREKLAIKDGLQSLIDVIKTHVEASNDSATKALLTQFAFRLLNESGKTVGELREISYGRARVAAFAASAVPLAIDAAPAFEPNTPGEDIMAHVVRRMDSGEMPVDEYGARHVAFMDVEVELADPSDSSNAPRS